MCQRFPSVESWKQHSWGKKVLDDGLHLGSTIEVSSAQMSPAYNGKYTYDSESKIWNHTTDPDLYCEFGYCTGQKSASKTIYNRWAFESRKKEIGYFKLAGTVKPPEGGDSEAVEEGRPVADASAAALLDEEDGSYLGSKCWNHGSLSYRGEDGSMRVKYVGGPRWSEEMAELSVGAEGEGGYVIGTEEGAAANPE